MDLVLLKPGLPGLADPTPGDWDLHEPATKLDGCIELVSVHFGMQQQVNTDVTNSARTSGRPAFQDITLVRYLDRVSPLLYRHCLTAAPIDDGETPTQILLCRGFAEDNGAPTTGTLMTITLWNCLIVSIEAQSHPNDFATEQLTLNFTDIEWDTTEPVGAAGQGGGARYRWSVARNRGFD